MILNWIIGIIIFGYASFMIYRHIQNSKKSKCAGCPLKKNCSSVDGHCDPSGTYQLDLFDTNRS